MGSEMCIRDRVYDSNQRPEPVSQVAAAAVVSVPNSPSSSNPEVAATGFNRKPKKNKNQNQANNAPAATSNKPNTTTSQKGRGTRHPTARGSDDKLCKIHFKWGDNGNFCAAPWQCPMKDVFKSPQ